MKIQEHPNFRKAFKKRIKNNKKLVEKTRERVKKFIKNPQDTVLKDHGLTGKLKDKRAFWITGDIIRIIYFPLSDDEVIFLDIGSHNQVY